MFTKFKKFAAVAAACLTTACLLTGCGGSGGGKADAPKKVVNEDLPGKEVKLGEKTYKVMPIKNESDFKLIQSADRGLNIAAAGNNIYYLYTAKDGTKVAKFTLTKDAVKVDNLAVVKATQNSDIATDGTSLYAQFGKINRVTGDKKPENVYGRGSNIAVPQGNPNTAYLYNVQNEIFKATLENGKYDKLTPIFGKYADRTKAGMIIGVPHILAYDDQLFIYGQGLVYNPPADKKVSVGAAYLCDGNGKILTKFAGIVDVKATEYAANIRAAAVYEKSILAHDNNMRQIISYDKATGKANGKMYAKKFFDLKRDPNNYEFARLNAKRAIVFIPNGTKTVDMFLVDEK